MKSTLVWPSGILRHLEHQRAARLRAAAAVHPHQHPAHAADLAHLDQRRRPALVGGHALLDVGRHRFGIEHRGRADAHVDHAHVLLRLEGAGRPHEHARHVLRQQHLPAGGDLDGVREELVVGAGEGHAVSRSGGAGGNGGSGGGSWGGWTGGPGGSGRAGPNGRAGRPGERRGDQERRRHGQQTIGNHEAPRAQQKKAAQSMA